MHPNPPWHMRSITRAGSENAPSWNCQGREDLLDHLPHLPRYAFKL
jgi:hypothetical protein